MGEAGEEEEEEERSEDGGGFWTVYLGVCKPSGETDSSSLPSSEPMVTKCLFFPYCLHLGVLLTTGKASIFKPIPSERLRDPDERAGHYLLGPFQKSSYHGKKSATT